METRLYKPEYRDLWFRRSLLEDPETMSYNRAWGGTILFPEERWDSWYGKWVRDPGTERFYRYIVTDSGCFVGEAAYHMQPESGLYLADLIVGAQFRNRGYGGNALELLCSAAKENGLNALYDDIAAENPAVSLFLRHGFSEAYRTDTVIMLKRELQ